MVAGMKVDMLSVDEALARVLDPLRPLQSETLPLHSIPQLALGRVLAEPVRSTLDLPPFRQSAVDGYAVRHADLQNIPCELPVASEIAAAARADAPTLSPGTAARIFTGGWLPDTADTVVRQELTRRDGDRVHVLEALAPGTDIRLQGEELKVGDTVAEPGALITPGLLGAIAMAGVGHVSTWRKPRIAVLVTGDEVAEPGAPLAPGQIADANGPLLRAYLAHWGYADVQVRYVRDHFDTVCEALADSFAHFDVVITTGGVSVGDHDHVPKAAVRSGAETLFWKVAQKPGMPLYVAARGRSTLFGLPGNPASVLVNLLVYVRPALARLEGRAAPIAWHRGRLASPVRAETAKTFWLRMQHRIDEAGTSLLQPLPKQASHMLSNLAQAAVLVRIPPQAGGHCAQGQMVEWTTL
ncbi:gephyrin-like molybdotransferase Glp [Hydrocarboniphaga effusa]|uniref:molybdopterin molybdotransferase MoeA n=1 Tax=Hydrocarboniphaga effusa TaxID=243629 RepID=UPI0031383D83